MKRSKHFKFLGIRFDVASFALGIAFTLILVRVIKYIQSRGGAGAAPPVKTAAPAFGSSIIPTRTTINATIQEPNTDLREVIVGHEKEPYG